jgi:LysM repeat protein
VSSSPSSRWLAPAALAAAFLAVVILAASSLGGDDPSPSNGSGAGEANQERAETQAESADGEPGTGTETETTATTDTSGETGKSSYRVKPGDTLSSIAGTTGLSLEELEQLNPGVDSQSLTVGQELKLKP